VNKKKIKNKSTLKILILSFIILSLGFVFLSLDKIRLEAKKKISGEKKMIIKKFFFSEDYLNEIDFLRQSNYNQKILPFTEFVKVSLTKKNIKNLKKSGNTHYNILNNTISNLKKFYITTFNSQIILIDSKGTIIKLDHEKNFFETKIKSNSSELQILDLKDAHVIENDLYISYSFKKSENCNILKIAKSNLLQKNLKFQIFFKTDECIQNLIAGRMATFSLNGKKDLLITTGDDGRGKKYAQLDSSIYGKIILINSNDGNYEILSKGHRNPQGLLVIEDIILSTEHGPKGGDEINLIKKNGNYGWPVSSYGEDYKFKTGTIKNYLYAKNHDKEGFIEPIFSFVPSIGISQIVNVPNNLSKLWIDNFFVSSLNGRSLYRVKFDKNYLKVIYMEKVIIGERIRDIVFFPENKVFLLALEDSGSIGFLKVDEK